MKGYKNIFLKVDNVEPVYEGCYSISNCRMGGIKVWIGNNGHHFDCDSFTVCDPDDVIEAGRRQVIALAKEIYELPVEERIKAFGNPVTIDILLSATYDDLVEKLDAWKKEKDEIKVKDEVEHTEFGYKAVVIGIQKDEYGHDHIFAITNKKRFITDLPASDFKKTGVHVDDLDKYLGV